MCIIFSYISLYRQTHRKYAYSGLQASRVVFSGRRSYPDVQSKSRWPQTLHTSASVRRGPSKGDPSAITHIKSTLVCTSVPQAVHGLVKAGFYYYRRRMSTGLLMTLRLSATASTVGSECSEAQATLSTKVGTNGRSIVPRGATTRKTCQPIGKTITGPWKPAISKLQGRSRSRTLSGSTRPRSRLPSPD